MMACHIGFMPMPKTTHSIVDPNRQAFPPGIACAIKMRKHQYVASSAHAQEPLLTTE